MLQVKTRLESGIFKSRFLIDQRLHVEMKFVSVIHIHPLRTNVFPWGAYRYTWLVSVEYPRVPSSNALSNALGFYNVQLATLMHSWTHGQPFWTRLLRSCLKKIRTTINKRANKQTNEQGNNNVSWCLWIFIYVQTSTIALVSLGKVVLKATEQKVSDLNSGC